MSAGWEALVRITPNDCWAETGGGTIGRRGYFLYADSEALDYGAQTKERDTKLVGNRESQVDSFSVDRYYPKGNITLQPRVDDILMLLMAHFQNVVKSGTGTYTFYRVPNQLNWGSGGSNIGTNPYSVNVDVFLGNSFITQATQSNGYRYTNGFVDKITFSQKFGEDLIMTPDFKFYAGSYYTFPSNFGPLTVYGSFSQFGRFVDYMGTFSVAGESYQVDSWQGVFDNHSVDKSQLGIRGYNRYPLAGKWIADGSFDMELNRDLQALTEGAFENLTMTMFNTSSALIIIAQPNIAYRPFEIKLSNGNSLVELSKPYRAYPPVGTTGPSTLVTVITGTTYGTALLGF